MPQRKEQNNSDIYESNLTALKERYPDLWQYLKKERTEPPVNMVKFGSRSRFPDILLESDLKQAFYYGKDDPVTYCRDYIAALDLHYAPVLVFMGFGLGYQVAAAVNHFAKELDIRHMVIIEKDIETFRAAMMTLDYTHIIRHPDIELIIGADSDGIFNVLLDYYKRRLRITQYLKSLKIIIMPSIRYMERPYYEKATEALKSSIMVVLQQFGNDPYDGIRGIDYTLKNLMPILDDPWISGFKNMFEGKPAILVGAGPSLNREIDFLKEASHKALLVCVDAALVPLLKKGITPQIVTNMERGKGQSGFFKGVTGLENTFFIYCAVVYPDTYDSYEGQKIISHRYKEMSQWLGMDMGVLTAGPLVGNYAFDIAEYLGCDPIIMVGQDLAVPLSGATHVDGFVFGTMDQYRENMVEVKGNAGETLMASRSFYESRRSLEEQIDDTDALCINATVGGAKINGATLMDLKTAVNTYCPADYDFLSELKAVWNREKSGKKEKTAEVDRLIRLLGKSVSAMKGAMDQCRKGLDLIRKFEEGHVLFIDKAPNPEIEKEVKALDRQIEEMRQDLLFRPELKFMSTVLGGYYTDFCMRKHFCYDQYDQRSFASLKALLMEKEILTILGQLFLSTIFLVEKNRERLGEAIHG